MFRATPAAVQRQLDRLRRRGSILDTLNLEARRFNRTLPAADRERLDQYLTSVREVEQRLQTAGEWEQRPKPKTSRTPPKDIGDSKRFFDQLRLMLDMTKLAFESDSTRIITLTVDTFRAPVFRLPKSGRDNHDLPQPQPSRPERGEVAPARGRRPRTSVAVAKAH